MLGYRLRHEHGYDVRTFSYPTMSGVAADICRDLTAFASERGGRGQGAFRRPQPWRGHRVPRPGGRRRRPLRRQRGAARVAAERQQGSPGLGPLADAEALARAARAERTGRTVRPLWGGGTAVGAIAGTLRMAPAVLRRFDEENDGTVAVSETRIPDWPITSSCRTAISACCTRATSRRTSRNFSAPAASLLLPLPRRAGEGRGFRARRRVQRRAVLRTAGRARVRDLVFALTATFAFRPPAPFLRRGLRRCLALCNDLARVACRILQDRHRPRHVVDDALPRRLQHVACMRARSRTLSV